MQLCRTEKDLTEVHIRWMIRRDMADVLEIEEGSFDFPWVEEDFLRCLRQRNCIGMIAEVGEKLVGFVIYELFQHRLQILNFAIHPDYRRTGVGTVLVNKLIGKLSGHCRTRIALEIRETNLEAQLFFRALGFRAVRVLRDYFEDSGEDAFLLHYGIGTEVVEEVEEPVNRIAQFEES